jgi:hypothetical protein
MSATEALILRVAAAYVALLLPQKFDDGAFALDAVIKRPEIRKAGHSNDRNHSVLRWVYVGFSRGASI